MSFSGLLYINISPWICRWKVHEACMLSLGSVKTIITENVKNGRVQFDMHGFLANVILADLNLPGNLLVHFNFDLTSVYGLECNDRIWSACYSIPSSLSIPVGSGLMGSQSLHRSDVPRAHSAVPTGHCEWFTWEPATLCSDLSCESYLGVRLLFPVSHV